MKKKHELLKYAYDNYPKGTKFITLLEKASHKSTGAFELNEEDFNSIADANTGQYVYEYGKWAEIIPESILSGKVAIQVNNEREFKLLMEHYDKKGWRSKLGAKPMEFDFEKHLIPTYNDKFVFLEVGCNKGFDPYKNDYKIIPFKDFAAEIEIVVPVLFMKSHDNMELYLGDYCYIAKLLSKEWRLDWHHGEVSNRFKVTDNGYFVNNENKRIFSSKEAAESWIKEHNKPKTVTVQLFNEFHTAIVRKDWISLQVQSADYSTTTLIKPSDLEDMLYAYKSLQ